MIEAEKYLKENGFERYDRYGMLLDKEKDSRSTEERCNIHLDQIRLRHEYITKFGFAIPTEAALKTIAALQPILEIGAGSGYWAYEIRKLTKKIIPVEPRLTEYGFWKDGKRTSGHWEDKTWTSVVKITGEEAVKQYPEMNLLFCWPDYEDPWSGQVLKQSKCKFVAYVGEWGGCTGNEEFHETLEKDFMQVKEVSIPNFFGIHDSLMVFERNAPKIRERRKIT